MPKINHNFLITMMCLLLSNSVIAQQAVEVKNISEVTFARTLKFPARVVNLELSSLAAETSGRILKFDIEVGDRVKKGQKLVSINCKTAILNQNRIKAGLKRLQAQRQLTQQQLERAQRLSSSRSISREELDQRQTQLDADDASIEEQQSLLDSAAQDIEYCQLKAPFSGTIIEKLSNFGSYVTPGTPLVKLLNENAVEIELEIPQSQVSVLQKANQIYFYQKDKQYPVSLRSILPWINPATHQQLCRLSIQTQQPPPGGSRGVLRFETPQHYIPAELIQKRENSLGIFILRNNKAVFKPLTQAEEGQSVAVTLPPDTTIITSPLQLLSDQQSITLEP